MSVNSCMQFVGYEVNMLHFELTGEYDKSKEFRILPVFKTALHKTDNGLYSIQLSVKIQSSNQNPLPFNLDVVINGHFTMQLDNDDALKQTLLNHNTVAILFPYLRSIVTSLTATANIPPLILPVINVTKTFKE